jgi:hypothetical protein
MDKQIAQDASPEGRPNLRCADGTTFIYDRLRGVYEPYIRSEEEKSTQGQANAQAPEGAFSEFWHEHWASLASTGLSLLTLVVLCFYTNYARRQAHASEDATKATQNAVILQLNSTHIDERAWVGVSDIQRTERPDGVSVNLLFMNTGKTPAQNFTIRVSGEPIPKGQQPTTLESLQPGRGIIAPNGIFHSNLSASGSVDSKTSDLVIHGRIDYTDVFGAGHWTKFCYYWTPKIKKAEGGFAPCDFGNEMDVTPSPQLK